MMAFVLFHMMRSGTFGTNISSIYKNSKSLANSLTVGLIT